MGFFNCENEDYLNFAQTQLIVDFMVDLRGIHEAALICGLNIFPNFNLQLLYFRQSPECSSSSLGLLNFLLHSIYCLLNSCSYMYSIVYLFPIPSDDQQLNPQHTLVPQNELTVSI